MTDYMDKIDGTKAPKLWRDMTPEEKGALLLAHHEGKVIETWFRGAWIGKGHGGWGKQNAYRIRPESKRETVTLHGYVQIPGDGAQFDDAWINHKNNTHRITLPVIDGDLPPGTYTSPDGHTITVERIK